MRLNPDKIYVENVRSLLHVPYGMAIRVCETAVRQGVFRRGYEVECPNQSVAVSVERESDIPQTVKCWVERDGHTVEVEFPTESLQIKQFYRLNELR